jgi:hypothetical protein
MGFRTNAENLNLNRDYTKLDTPELRALLDLWRRWDPVVYVDLHTTDGAQFEHDVAVMVAPRGPREGSLDEAGRALSAALQERLTRLGHLPLAFYPSFVENDNPASGFEDGEAPPRFSQAYAVARGRIGILVETHSWRRYGERARSTYHCLQALFERAGDAGSWQKAAREAEAAELGGREVALLFHASEKARTIDFRGYHYERRKSDVSGAQWTTYDERRPEVWKVPLRDELVPALSVTAPRAGYVVGAGFAAAVAPRLDLHGIRYQRTSRAITTDAEAFRVTKAEYDPPFEGRTRARLTGAWKRERREVAPGALWIPIAQPRALLVLHLLEPSAPDSFAAWGFFNGALEQKEYMEGYVAEQVAREMLKDPAVRAAFDAELKDPAFAASPARRLDFFYRRHPSYDERKDILPVLRLDAAPDAFER